MLLLLLIAAAFFCFGYVIGVRRGQQRGEVRGFEVIRAEPSERADEPRGQ